MLQMFCQNVNKTENHTNNSITIPATRVTKLACKVLHTHTQNWRAQVTQSQREVYCNWLKDVDWGMIVDREM